MICENCGHDNDDNDLFCRNYGKVLEKSNRPKINLSKNGVTKSETTETDFADTPTDVKHGKGNEKNNNKKLKQQKFTGKYDFQKHNNA